MEKLDIGTFAGGALLHSGDIEFGGKGGIWQIGEAMQLGSRIHRKIQGHGEPDTDRKFL